MTVCVCGFQSVQGDAAGGGGAAAGDDAQGRRRRRQEVRGTTSAVRAGGVFTVLCMYTCVVVWLDSARVQLAVLCAAATRLCVL